MTPRWVRFAEVKAAVSMRLVLEDYGVLEKLRRSGREQYRGRCPIHRGEGRDAFHAHLGKNVFHCFACGAGGNVLDLVAKLEQCSMREAGLRLQRRYVAGGLAPAPRQSEPGEGQLVTEKRKGNAVLPFSLPGLVAEHVTVHVPRSISLDKLRRIGYRRVDECAASRSAGERSGAGE